MQGNIVATTDHASYLTMGIYAVVMTDSKVGTVKLLIIVLGSTVIIMETAPMVLIVIRAIAMQYLWAKTVKQQIIAFKRAALAMEHVRSSTTPINVLVTLDILAKTVNMITVLIQHVLTMVHVLVDNTPTHVDATLVTQDMIVNTRTVIQSNVKIAPRV